MRPWREADIAAQLKAFSDPLFERFSDWAPDTNADAVRYLVEHEAARLRGEQLELALVQPHRAVRQSASGSRPELAGVVSLRALSGSLLAGHSTAWALRDWS